MYRRTEAIFIFPIAIRILRLRHRAPPACHIRQCHIIISAIVQIRIKSVIHRQMIDRKLTFLIRQQRRFQCRQSSESPTGSPTSLVPYFRNSSIITQIISDRQRHRFIFRCRQHCRVIFIIPLIIIIKIICKIVRRKTDIAMPIKFCYPVLCPSVIRPNPILLNVNLAGLLTFDQFDDITIHPGRCTLKEIINHRFRNH